MATVPHCAVEIRYFDLNHYDGEFLFMTIYLKNLYRRLNVEIYFFASSLLLVKEEEIKKSPPDEIQQRTKLFDSK